MQNSGNIESSNSFGFFNELKLVFFYFLLYLLVFNSLLFRFGPGVEDVQTIPDLEWIWAVQGRWGTMLLRYFLGGGPCYPASGIAAGFMLSIAFLFQTKILGITTTWGKCFYGASCFFCFQWVHMLPFAGLCDGVAFSLICCTFSAYFLIYAHSKRMLALAAVMLCFGLSCYQSCSFYYGALVIFIILLQQEDKLYIDFGFIKRVVSITIVGVALYLAMDFVFKLYAPLDQIAWAKEYQGSMTGYKDLKNCTGVSDFLTLFYTQVFAPMCHDVLGQRAGESSKIYILVWPAVLLYMIFWWKKHSVFCNIIRCFLIISLIFLPYVTTLLLFSPKVNDPRVWMAQPLVFAGMWALLYRKYNFSSQKLNAAIFVVSTVLIFKVMYYSSAKARDEVYYIDRAKEELLEMNILAKTEEAKTGLSNVPYLICGTLKEGASGIFRSRVKRNFYLHEALPVFYGDKNAFDYACIDSYKRYFRMPNFSIANNAQEEEYASALSTMPCWPELGSVKAVKNAVLIKIGSPKGSL